MKCKRENCNNDTIDKEKYCDICEDILKEIRERDADSRRKYGDG